MSDPDEFADRVVRKMRKLGITRARVRCPERHQLERYVNARLDGDRFVMYCDSQFCRMRINR